MHIMTVVGARPQFVKAAVVSRTLEQAGVQESIIHTGQHYDHNLSEVFFEELGLPKPKHHLNIGSNTHGAQTGDMIKSIEAVLMDEKPDALLVYGDTNSTLAGSLAAAKLHIPIAHVEAGLRSYNRKMPEEINRVMTDHLSSWLFVPTESAIHNLEKEGIDASNTHLVGDVMYDAVQYYGEHGSNTLLKELGLQEKNYVLATVHRASNTNDVTRLKAIFEALDQLAGEITVLIPLHPRTKSALEKHHIIKGLKNVSLVDPQGFLSMMQLEKNAKLIVTDSGGVQKEAYFHHVPCVTLRDETEWVETVEAGWNRLAPPTDSESILHHCRATLDVTPPDYPSLYGDGDAGNKIANIIKAGL